jgi:hypothetical protein
MEKVFELDASRVLGNTFLSENRVSADMYTLNVVERSESKVFSGNFNLGFV